MITTQVREVAARRLYVRRRAYYDLVAFLLVDNVNQRLAIGKARDICFHRAEHAGAVFIGTAGDVRSNDCVVEFP